MASSFAEDFLRGVMMARAQKEQKRRGDLEQQQFMLQSDRQRAQDKRQGILDQQGEAARVFEFLKQQAMPREELPAGQAGPAAPAPRPTIKLPLLSGGVQEIQPQYAEDVATQQRAAQDVARTAKLEDYAQQSKLQREAQMRSLPPEIAAKLGLDPSQPVDMNVAQLASTIRAGDESRAAAAAARADVAAARGGVAAEKRDAMQATVGAYVDALRDGSMAAEAIPTTIRGQVLAAAQQAGVKPLARKELEQIKGLQSMEAQAADLRDTFKPGAVGPLEGRIPGFALGRESAGYRAAAQGLFNELGKLRSGGAITPQEFERLSGELPLVTDTETVFRAKLDRFLSSLAQKRQAILAPVNRGASGPAAAPAGNNDPLGLGL